MITNHIHVAHRPFLAAIVLACLAVAVLPTISKAAPTVFSNAPYDPNSIFNPAVDANGITISPNINNGWDQGRGMRFTMNADESITSFGVLQDVTRKTLNFEIFDITKNAVLVSGALESYSRDRLKAGHQVVRESDLQFRAANIRNPVLKGVRNAVMRNFLSRECVQSRFRLRMAGLHAAP